MVHGSSAPGPVLSPAAPGPVAAPWHCPPLSKVPSRFQHVCTQSVSRSHSTTCPPPHTHTTQGRGAECLLSLLLFLWQPRAHEGVAGGCAAPTAVPARPFLLQPKRLRCDRCSSVRILPPHLPQEA